MGLFSFLGKNKQDRTAEDSGHFYRTADDAATGEHARSKRASHAGEGARRGRDAKGGADAMLPEKKRARRRLVGAIALALAAAVGLPMLLDSEPKPLAGDIAIQIPPKDKAAPLPVPAPTSAAVNPADSVDKGEEIVEPPKPSTAAPARSAPALAVAEVRAQTRPETAIPVVKPEPTKVVEHTRPEPKQEQPKPEHKAAPKPETKPESKPESKLADKPKAPKADDKPKAPKAADDKPAHPLATDDSARALAILEGKAAEKAASDKAAADKAHEAAGAGDKVVLQVAALGSADKAAELQARLRDAGIHSFTQKLSRPGGDLIRVKVGPLSRDEADKVRARLGKLGLSGTPGPA
jgi:DedD protein